MSLELRVDLKKVYPKLCPGCQKIMIELVEYAPPKEMIHNILMGETSPGAKKVTKKDKKKTSKKG